MRAVASFLNYPEIPDSWKLNYSNISNIGVNEFIFYFPEFANLIEVCDIEVELNEVILLGWTRKKD